MKRIIWPLLILLLGCQAAMAQEAHTRNDQQAAQARESSNDKKLRKAKQIAKLRIGFLVSPLLSWVKQDSHVIDRGKVRGGVEYGGIVEYFFHPNYGISTGITVLYNGGNLIYKDSTFNNHVSFHGSNITNIPTHARFKFQYLTIPVSLKLKTNQIGYFTYYGELGLLFGFCVQGKVDASQNDELIYDNDNILKLNNPNNVFSSTIVNLSLHAGGGIEYAISDRVSLLLGLMYNNGFLNVMKDGDDKDVKLNNIVLKVGVLF